MANRLIPFNRFGIVGLESVGVTLSGGTLTYEFEAHPYVNTPFNGLLLIRLNSPSPTGLTGTEPIYFESKGLLGSRKAVTKAGGVPLIASDIVIPSYNLFFYDFRTGVVEAVASVPNSQQSLTSKN